MDIGKKCSFPHCKLKDFLPFTCDHCSRPYCIEHRTYASHSCEGANAKDSRSLACPICEKSVRFFANENVDEVWDKHYTRECTQEAATKKKATTCANSTCHKRLGPTNFFICGKCHLKLCLGCRLQETHSCKALNKSEALASAATRRIHTASSSLSHDGKKTHSAGMQQQRQRPAPPAPRPRSPPTARTPRTAPAAPSAPAHD